MTLPALFRYPGPFGLRDTLHGGLVRLGPGGDAHPLWLAETIEAMAIAGPERFGGIAVLDAASFDPQPTGVPGEWVGRNRRLRPDDELPWVPAVVIRAPLPWADLRTGGDVREAFGPAAFDEAFGEAVADLQGYVEELDALGAVGIAGPDHPWIAVPPAERKKILDQHGVKPRWTAAS